MEDKHRARYEEKAQSLHDLPKYAPLSKAPDVYQPWSSPNPVHWGFMEASFHRHDWLTHFSSMTDSTSTLSPLNIPIL